ncbi:unnamed protein product [Pedinophyceae sp. YPF-701]|nr:unnamed protein product [Pedinophyceae sp. YPF-701]
MSARRGGKPSLADDLGDLLTPTAAPERDPLNDETGGGAGLLGDVDDADISFGPMGAARLRADVHMEGEAYRGRRSSRAAVFGEEPDGRGPAAPGGASGSDGGASDDTGGSDGAAESSGDDAEDGDQAASMSEDEDAGAASSPRSSDEDDGGGASDDDSDEDVRDLGGAGAGGDLDDELDAQELSERAHVEQMRERRQREQSKGRAVRNQRRLYEKALGCRILLQKPLVGAYRLPSRRVAAQIPQVAPEAGEALEAVRREARDTVATIVAVMDALMERNPAIEDRAGVLGRGDLSALSSSKLWRAVEARDGVLAPFRDAAVDRWHRRTILTSGKAALKMQGLQALSQSVSQQVSGMMAELPRSLERSRLAYDARPAVLCGGPAPERPAAARDPETYDDGEFYRLTLREFLESEGGKGAPAPHAKKARKDVDRRASKGRKLRYHVQEKLVAFTAPVHEAHHALSSQIFNNLFGSSS